jgi:hypothetical protein
MPKRLKSLQHMEQQYLARFFSISASVFLALSPFSFNYILQHFCWRRKEKPKKKKNVTSTTAMLLLIQFLYILQQSL